MRLCRFAPEPKERRPSARVDRLLAGPLFYFVLLFIRVKKKLSRVPLLCAQINTTVRMLRLFDWARSPHLTFRVRCFTYKSIEEKKGLSKKRQRRRRCGFLAPTERHHGKTSDFRWTPITAPLMAQKAAAKRRIAGARCEIPEIRAPRWITPRSVGQAERSEKK